MNVINSVTGRRQSSVLSPRAAAAAAAAASAAAEGGVSIFSRTGKPRPGFIGAVKSVHIPADGEEAAAILEALVSSALVDPAKEEASEPESPSTSFPMPSALHPSPSQPDCIPLNEGVTKNMGILSKLEMKREDELSPTDPTAAGLLPAVTSTSRPGASPAAAGAATAAIRPITIMPSLSGSSSGAPLPLADSFVRGGGSMGGSARLERSLSPCSLMLQTATLCVYVGAEMKEFHVSRETLVKMTYWRKKLAAFRQLSNPEEVEQERLHVDCDPDIFTLVLQVLRYQSFDALPSDLTPDVRFKLRKELQLLGADLRAPTFRHATLAGGVRATTSWAEGLADATDGSRSETGGTTTPEGVGGVGNMGLNVLLAASRRVSGEAKGAKTTSKPNVDQWRLDFVYRHGGSSTGVCACHASDGGHSSWLVSVFYGHIFCGDCGAVASNWPQRLVLEIVNIAARPQAARGSMTGFTSGWRYDHSARLSLVNMATYGHNCTSCRSSSCWALSPEYSHAFCVECLAVPTNPLFLAQLMVEAAQSSS